MRKKLVTILTALLLFVSPVQAGTGPDPICWFEPNPVIVGQQFILRAENLPTTYPFAVTWEPYPVGTTRWTIDGTFSWVGTAYSNLTAYFWVRGHGPSLIKAGPGLNDYHVIAICSL